MRKFALMYDQFNQRKMRYNFSSKWDWNNDLQYIGWIGDWKLRFDKIKFSLHLQGTNQEQDTRFSDKEKKLLKQMKFGNCLDKQVHHTRQTSRSHSPEILIFRREFPQVDMSKVKLDVLRPWISKKITEFLHIEDDVVVEFVYNQLEEKNVNIGSAPISR